VRKREKITVETIPEKQRYIFYRGDGNDTIPDSDSNGQHNVLIFPDYNLADVTLFRSGDALIFTFTKTGDSVRLDNLFKVGISYNIIDEVRFGNEESGKSVFDLIIDIGVRPILYGC